MLLFIKLYLNKEEKTTYNLIFHQDISANNLYRMKKGKPITTTTLDTLCFVLDCNISDIIAYVSEEEKKYCIL